MKINFIANRHWLNSNSEYKPSPSSDLIPEWYRNGDRFQRDVNGNIALDLDGNFALSWKACPALLDVFISGYTFKTPCDIIFYKDKNGEIDCLVSDKKYKDFIQKRNPMPGFSSPLGYYKTHFAWVSDWGIKTPDGYSSLYLTPINRFDLPFVNTIGIIDTDSVGMPGALPFFLIDGWTGTIPAGTPYIQILPFKRDNWEADYIVDPGYQVYNRIKENSKLFRTKNGGVYKNQFWKRKIFK